MTIRVLVDANVFYSRALADWLFHLRLQTESMFRLFSTEDVFAETLANLRDRNPTAPGHLIWHRAELLRRVVDEVLQDFPAAKYEEGMTGDVSVRGLRAV